MRDSGAFAGAAPRRPARGPADVPDIEIYAIDVSFDALPDRDEVTYLNDLPTSFALPPEAVDRLRAAAARHRVAVGRVPSPGAGHGREGDPATPAASDAGAHVPPAVSTASDRRGCSRCSARRSRASDIRRSRSAATASLASRRSSSTHEARFVRGGGPRFRRTARHTRRGSPSSTSSRRKSRMRSAISHAGCGRERVATPLHLKPARARIERQPVGVVGVISPWNYPVQLALVAGRRRARRRQPRDAEAVGAHAGDVRALARARRGELCRRRVRRGHRRCGPRARVHAACRSITCSSRDRPPSGARSRWPRRRT